MILIYIEMRISISIKELSLKQEHSMNPLIKDQALTNKGPRRSQDPEGYEKCASRCRWGRRVLCSTDDNEIKEGRGQ
jgi:hypothetical protein